PKACWGLRGGQGGSGTCVACRYSGGSAPSAESDQQSDLPRLATPRYTGRLHFGATSLWRPRRPLATLGRKSRQGRKAATVSIDAGAEVSRRGRHPSGLSKQQKRWPPGTAGPWRRPMPSPERDGTGGRGSNGIDRRGRRGQPAGPPSFWTCDTTEAPASWHCAAVAAAHAIQGTGWDRGARQQRYRSTRAPRSAGGAATLLGFRNNRSAGLLALRGRGDGPCHPGNGMAPGGVAATVSIDAGAEVSRA